jgi:hypothetical protein
LFGLEVSQLAGFDEIERAGDGGAGLAVAVEVAFCSAAGEEVVEAFEFRGGRLLLWVAAVVLLLVVSAVWLVVVTEHDVVASFLIGLLVVGVGGFE